MGTDVPWFKEGLGDLRGLDTLEKLAKVALGDGETRVSTGPPSTRCSAPPAPRPGRPA